VFVPVAFVLFQIARWPHPWWVTLLIGLSAGGAARGVEALVGWRKNTTPVHAAERTETDQAWEQRMALKKALAAEDRGKWDLAITLFEQIIQRDDNRENIRLARQHLESIRGRRPS
jgi:hypothetical protein